MSLAGFVSGFVPMFRLSASYAATSSAANSALNGGVSVSQLKAAAKELASGFNFALNVAVFQEMRRTAEYRWPSQERFGQLPARQYVGPGDETITLPGVIYPQWNGSANAMGKLRAMAAMGQPYMLIDAQGNMYGRWVITNVEETRSAYGAFAMPRKIEFSVTLQRFDGKDSSLLGDLLDKALDKAGIKL